MSISRIMGTNLVRIVVGLEGEVKITHLPPHIELVIDQQFADEGDEPRPSTPNPLDPTGLSEGRSIALCPPRDGLFHTESGEEFERSVYEEV